MPPSTIRRTTTAICRGLFLEKGIDITAEQAVVGELRPGLLLQLVGDHQGRGLVECGLGTPIHIALHIGQHRGVLCQRLHLLLLFGSQHGGHGFPDLAAHAPDLLAPKQCVAHRLILADARRGHGQGRRRTGIHVGWNIVRPGVPGFPAIVADYVNTGKPGTPCRCSRSPPRSPATRSRADSYRPDRRSRCRSQTASGQRGCPWFCPCPGPDRPPGKATVRPEIARESSYQSLYVYLLSSRSTMLLKRP